nr:MAG TPA: hypothetical protein [Caudoviricetes sp.]
MLPFAAYRLLLLYKTVSLIQSGILFAVVDIPLARIMQV